jgi:hypothetical protein
VFGARRAKRRMGLRGRPLRSFVTTTCIGCVRDIALMQPFDHPAASVDLGSERTCGSAVVEAGRPGAFIDAPGQSSLLRPHSTPQCSFRIAVADGKVTENEVMR